MTERDARRYRAGEPIPDLCRACKATRGHTVMATDAQGRVLRVVCGFCGSPHNYRGGGDAHPGASSPAPAAGHARPPPAAAVPAPSASPTERPRANAKGQDPE